ncbi:hypothetical protein EXIGLDRAFT_775348 [Exidia glandulosa HHB12029]|uniref:Protein-S-isoprenylcysteine O-methyltransferase n=1 Tax=Exidia glandulosa HHB12029 TaxID=1314781 RepID=A0A165DYS9_EXIGL|nr:hypothetical protein EXIGLDRAFT_775348 [Exidia glandulosa HHB12029]
MSLARVLLSVVATLASHRSHTAPHPRPPDTKVAPAASTFSEIYFLRLLSVIKNLTYIACVVEIVAFILNPQRDDVYATWLSGMGALLSVSGTLLRLWCFRVLGQRFTFQLATHDSNRLVTSGPYTFCRHPSYLGGILCFYGTCLVFLSPGSAIMARLGLVLGVVWPWAVCILAFLPPLWARIGKEEAMLGQEFKEEWTAYCRVVRARLVPGIL